MFELTGMEMLLRGTHSPLMEVLPEGAQRPSAAGFRNMYIFKVYVSYDITTYVDTAKL